MINIALLAALITTLLKSGDEPIMWWGLNDADVFAIGRDGRGVKISTDSQERVGFNVEGFDPQVHDVVLSNELLALLDARTGIVKFYQLTPFKMLFEMELPNGEGIRGGGFNRDDTKFACATLMRNRIFWIDVQAREAVAIHNVAVGGGYQAVKAKDKLIYVALVPGSGDVIREDGSMAWKIAGFNLRRGMSPLSAGTILTVVPVSRTIDPIIDLYDAGSGKSLGQIKLPIKKLNEVFRFAMSEDGSCWACWAHGELTISWKGKQRSANLESADPPPQVAVSPNGKHVALIERLRHHANGYQRASTQLRLIDAETGKLIEFELAPDRKRSP